MAYTDDITYAWLGPITKVERTPDAVMIYGKATDGSVDADEQIVDPEFAKKALADWFSTFANVRQMHSTAMAPAGKGVKLESMPDGEYVKSMIVEPTAMKLVDAGVYSGYSVGISRPRIVRDQRARGGRIVDGKIVELSVVDRPANGMAKFQIAKMAGDGSVDFIGKVVTVPAAFSREGGDPTPITRYQKGVHVTVHVRASDGTIMPVEGRVARRGRFGAVELDTRGYEYPGSIAKIAGEDIVAAYRGSVRKYEEKEQSKSVTTAVVEKTDGAAMGGALPPEEDKAFVAGHKPGCDGSFADDGKCSKCGGMKSAEKGADLSEITDDVGDLKDDIKDIENDLEDVTGQSSDDKDDDSDDDSKDDSGDKDDEDDSGDKVAKGKLLVALDGSVWKVTKGGVVLGSHSTSEAAVAQLAALKRERKAAKMAKKAAKAEAKKVAKAEVAKAEGPWLLKRAHDSVCPAYSFDTVSAAYPSVEKGAVMSDATRNAIYSELVDAVRSNAPTAGIAALTKALGGIEGMIAIADSGEEVGKLTKTVLDEQFEAFKSANPEFGASGGPALPSPSETVSAGQFKRPYLSAGHQQAVASDHTAKIPTTTHPIDAKDFTRGPLTDGHQRYIASKISDLHDGLSSWRPELCRISQMDADGSFAATRQPAASFVRQELGNQIPNQATANPVAQSLQMFPAAAPKVTALDPKELEQALTKALEPHLTKITKLEEEVARLSAMPDPGQAPFRGIATPSVTKSNGKGPQKAGQSKREQRIDYLRSLVSASDPSTRIVAQEQLARMGIDS